MKKYVTEYKGHKVPEGAEEVYFDGKNKPDFYLTTKAGQKLWTTCGSVWLVMKDEDCIEGIVELPLATEIDWDSAPEWADQCTFSNVTERMYWANAQQYTNVDTDLGRTVWEFKKTGGALCNFNLIEMRPVEDKAEWDGKGLPPAGCECEIAIKTPSPEWHKAAINYISDDTCVYKRPTGECSRYTGSLLFRPLKTQEEKEREDFHLAVVDACMGIYTEDFDVDGVARILFKAGFTAPKGEG